MGRINRYDTSGMTEDQYEPGSCGRVLKNLPGIKKKKGIDALETEELFRTTRKLIQTYGKDHRFTAKDICSMHKEWLGSIYEWAGRYRRVMISKGGFPFASPNQIPRLMNEFEQEILKCYTPCVTKNRSEIIHALAVVHTELIIIHPFREGNGRLARLLSIFMGLQADMPLLDFSGIRGKRKQAYFAAVHAGMAKNYEPMEEIFTSVVSWTQKTYKE